MRAPSHHLFQMGPLYQIRRNDGGGGGPQVHGLPSDDGNIMFPAETDLRIGDVAVVIASGKEFPIGRIESEVSGTQILYKTVFRPEEARKEPQSHSTNVTQHIGTVHGAVTGRDFHGNIAIDMSVGDVLTYLTEAVKKTPDSEEKRGALQKLSEITKHPAVAEFVKTRIGDVWNWVTSNPPA